MANFTDLVRAQRESGKGVIGSLSGAYNQQNMQKFDVRNKLFSRSGLATALFPGLKGYQAQAISSKSPGSMISPALGNSPTALSSIAKDARISARNSMALPSIARNMAKMVKIWGGTPSKYFDSAAEKETAKEAKFGRGGKGGGVLGKGSAAGGGGILGMLGGALGSIGSVAGSILGGIGSLVGGAFSGIFGVLGSALGGMGFVGILAAGAIGFILYQIWKNLDFSKLKEKLGLEGVFTDLGNAFDGLVKEIDGITGGGLSSFFKDVKNTFNTVANKTIAALQTGMQVMTTIGTAVLQDFIGYLKNFYNENKGLIFASMAIGAMGPAALTSLKGAALTALVTGIAAGYGTLTKEDTPKTLKEKIDAENDKISEAQKRLSNPNLATTEKQKQDIKDEIEARKTRISQYETLKKQKEEDTNHTQRAIDQVGNIGGMYEQNLNERLYNQTSQQFPTSPTPVSTNKKASISHQDAMNYLMSKGGYTKEQAAGIVANLHAESGMNSTVVAPGEGSFGLAQWNPKSGRLDDLKKFAKDRGKSESDPYVQLDFLMEELKNNSKYGDKDLRMASTAQDAAMIFQRKYERPKTISDVRASIASSLVGGSGSQVASAENKSTPAPGAKPTGSSGGSSLMASLAEPLQQLDKYLGGALGLGSVNVADMLRDLSNESGNNPTFIDNSNKNINNGGMQESSTVANAWDPAILSAILGRQTG